MRPVLLILIVLMGAQTANSQSYSRRQVGEDLDILMEKIEEVHYNPYLFISKETFSRKRDSILATLPDSTGFKELVLVLSKLTALLEDGHTAPSLVQNQLRPDFAKPIFFPLALWQEDGQLFAQSNGPILAGARLVTINGHRVDSLFREYRAGVGGNEAFQSELAARLFARNLYLSGIEAPFRIRYQQAGITKDTLLAEGLGFGKALNRSMPHIGGPPYSFRIIGNKLGYLDFKAMSGAPEAVMKLMDSALQELRRQKVQSLAIDLRDNSGGNSLIADVVIAYFREQPYSLMGKRYWKVSTAYQAYLRHNGDSSSPYQQQPPGSVWERGDCRAYPRKFQPSERFTGKVYLITGPFTFSSANMFADGFKEFRMGTIVGSPTGENTNDFGETLALTLPNSGVQVTTTTSYDIGVGCDPKAVHPVTPDVRIYTPVRERALGRDRELEWILKKSK